MDNISLIIRVSLVSLAALTILCAIWYTYSRSTRHIIQKLKSNSWEKQTSASDFLTKTDNPKYVDPLLREIKNDIFELSAISGMITYLGKHGDERVIDPIIDAAIKSNRNVYQEMVSALKNLGANTQQLSKAYIGTILTLLGGSDSAESAAQDLGKLGDKSAFEELAEGLNSNDTMKQRAIIFALGELGDKRGIRLLTNFLEDKETDLSNYAAQAIVKIHDKEKIDPLFSEIISNLKSRIPDGKHFSKDIQIGLFLRQALTYRKEGYDFQIVYHEEEGEMKEVLELPDDVRIDYVGDGGEFSGYGRSFAILKYSGGGEVNLGLTDDPDFSLEPYMVKCKKWVVNSPEKIEIVRGDKIS